jgi:threonine dehydrogenase-like Zn-dependent dehydrogenase
MKAVCWYGIHDMRVEDVPDPKILNPRDAIIRITTTAICGSDLHIFDGFMPGMRRGDIMGHEFMGEVVELGSAVKNLKVGDRVVIPFAIACGGCFFCKKQLFSLCDNSNPKAELAAKMWGYTTAGLFGYTHLTGGYAGGQAQLARVPFADVGAHKIPDHIPDQQAFTLTDILPTGYQAAWQCDIEPGDVVAVWGCGPVGQMTIRSAQLLGAERIIAIDSVPERLDMAASCPGVEVLNHDERDVYDTLMDWTGGMGPDCCIDAVGMEAHGMSLDAVYDNVKTTLMLATDRIHVLRQILRCCRKGGKVSIPGVYGGFADKVPLGAAFQKGLTLRGGQTHVHRWLPELIDHISSGRLDPSFVVTHHLPLAAAPQAYKTFRDKKDNCIKVILDPWAEPETYQATEQQQEQEPAAAQSGPH